MSDKIYTQHQEIVEAVGKKLLDAANKDTNAPEYLKTLAEAYEITRRAGIEY